MAKFLTICVFTSIWATTYALDTPTDPEAQLPVVDLGYGLYQASFNVCYISGDASRLH
jgi:hypothetical protein